jgi:outer membrane protein assembly factor BamA
MAFRMAIARALVAIAVLGMGTRPAAALTRSYIPLPEILTDPNEGNTYGFLPVVLFLDDQKIIQYILAPDVRYNKITGVHPTFRLFGYPSVYQKWSIVLGKSEKIDQDYELRYEDNAFWQGRARLFADAEFEDDSTERFFGFGNSSSEKEESNYTARHFDFVTWLAYRLQPTLSFTYQTRVRWFRVRKGGVDSLPFIGVEHPGTPGLDGATIVGQQVGFLYDTRDDTNITREGALGLATAEVMSTALGSSLSYVKYAAEARKFIPVHDRVVLAMHARADYIQGPHDVPFFEQNEVGGHDTLRGFGSGRFVDKDRVFASAELRTRVYQRFIFGVNAQLELAPFVDFGQVFHTAHDSPVSNLHPVGGLGFRGVVPPQVVGFVDVGVGEQGVTAFTGLDYPF